MRQQMYSYDRTASQYSTLFSKLVQSVDKFSDASKEAVHVEMRLKELEDAVARDGFEDDPRGDKAYGFEQAVSEVRTALVKAQEAIGRLEQEYDYLNKWALRNGLK